MADAQSASPTARSAAVAGTFYTNDPAALGNQVDAALAAAAKRFPAPAQPPKAVIAPHAGYVYSGDVAASAYAQIAALRGTVSRVILLGPNHRVPLQGIAVPTVEAFETPLGRIPLDRAALDKVLALPFAEAHDAAHAQEHSLEVHLPFLQRALGDFALVPLVVAAPPDQVERVLEMLWGGPETLIVISTDLSHYHPYEHAQKFDGAASLAIETLAGDKLEDHQACGRLPVRGLLRRARALDLRPTTLDLRNSGDTAGSKDKVVGYGSWSLEYAASARLPDQWRTGLKEIAKQTIVKGAGQRQGGDINFNIPNPPRPLLTARATFVTVTLAGQLRGCIGSILPHRPLLLDVAQNAHKAAFSDPRFKPVGADEADQLGFKVSILSTPRPIAFKTEAELVTQLRPDTDGVILVEGQKRGLFLPQVWEQLPDSKAFLTRLKAKAGLPGDYWSESLQAYRFTTETF